MPHIFRKQLPNSAKHLNKSQNPITTCISERSVNSRQRSTRYCNELNRVEFLDLLAAKIHREYITLKSDTFAILLILASPLAKQNSIEINFGSTFRSSRRIRATLQDESLVTKFISDLAENEPSGN